MCHGVSLRKGTTTTDRSIYALVALLQTFLLSMLIFMRHLL